MNWFARWLSVRRQGDAASPVACLDRLELQQVLAGRVVHRISLN